jgi:hypothetical protein
MSHAVSYDRTSVNASKMSYMAHILIERYEQERRDRRIAGIIRLTKNHDRNYLHYLRELGVRIRNRHTPSERVVTFRNTPISVLVSLRKTGLLGDVEQVYVGCFGKKRKRGKKGSRRGKR